MCLIVSLIEIYRPFSVSAVDENPGDETESNECETHYVDK